jgi:hypothetical protein
MASFHGAYEAMALELINRLLSDPDPAFACYTNRDPAKKEGFLAPVAHFANPPAKPSLLNRVPDVAGARQAERLYATYNGLLLYTTPEQSDLHGVEIFPIDQWKQRTAQMVESWEGHYPKHDMPYGHDDFIAFAHSRGASSYIHWVTRGPRAGSIYWWAWTMRPYKHTPPMAEDFGAFIKLLYDRPAYFFNELLLSYTRFSDGSGKEWLPSRYLPDRSNPAVGR